MVGGVTTSRMSISYKSMIRYFKCLKSHELSAKQCIMIGRVTLSHSIFVDILILFGYCQFSIFVPMRVA